MRWVVAFPTGRGTVSFKTTQVSFWLSSPHLPHFNYWLQQQNENEKQKETWKSCIWLIGRDEGKRKKPWKGKGNWDHRSHLGVEDWWGSQAPQWSSTWSSPFFFLSLCDTVTLLLWVFDVFDGSRHCYTIVVGLRN